jgi:uncharacterized protein (DUF488 family)
MDTAALAAGLDELMRCAAKQPTAIMCAEALWWQCHRRLLGDALAASGAKVVHILASGTTTPHEITPFARVSGTRVSYPGLL